jgi:RsiW-degrading membrane proteinase PrsW (M82 family)
MNRGKSGQCHEDGPILGFDCVEGATGPTGPEPEPDCSRPRSFLGVHASPFLIFMGVWIAGAIWAIMQLGPESRLALILLAVTPPMAYMSFILYMDRREPEPILVVLKVMALGALSAIPAAGIEFGLDQFPLFQTPGLAGAALNSFIKIAPVEEAGKLGAVWWFFRKSACFNEENDGIVYVGASALGFALVENLLFVMALGFDTGLSRALTAIPLHTFTGVIMGYFVGLAKFAPARRGLLIGQGFGLAYFIHAVYDMFGMSDSWLGLFLFPTVILLSVGGIIYLNKGRMLSLRRWQPRLPESGGEPGPARSGDAPSAPSPSQAWKLIASRSLFGLCAIFWVAAVLVGSDPNSGLTMEECAPAGILFTFWPVAIGILLEISHRRHRNHPVTVDNINS